MRDNGATAETLALSDDFINGFPEAQADAFRHIEDFLNLHIYTNNVTMGKPHNPPAAQKPTGK